MGGPLGLLILNPCGIPKRVCRWPLKCFSKKSTN